VIYHQRWEATQIFDTAVDRVTAAQALKDWIAEVRATDLDWEPFITMLEGHWDGILAYFDDRCSSGPVEGINNKIRTVMRRGYGIHNIATLWTRIIWTSTGLGKRWARRSLAYASWSRASKPFCQMLT